MIELKPFTENDFESFKSWTNSVEELFQFAGPLFTFPVTDEQLLNYIRMRDKKPYKVILKSTNEAIGHCELNYENGNRRLSRILVGKKDLRGQKIGEHIVREMVRLFFEDPKVETVDLNVYDWNKGAIKCYENVGFRIRHELTGTVEVNGAVWTQLNMALTRENMSLIKTTDMINRIIFTFCLISLISCSIKTKKASQITKFYTISTNNYFEQRKSDTILQKEIEQHKESDTLFQQYVFSIDKERHFLNGFTNYPHAPPDGDYVSYELDNLGIIYTKSLTWKSYTRLHSTNDSINDLIEIALEHVILNQDLEDELKKLIPKQQKLIQF